MTEAEKAELTESARRAIKRAQALVREHERRRAAQNGSVDTRTRSWSEIAEDIVKRAEERGTLKEDYEAILRQIEKDSQE